jgi:hypothetical protein
MEMLVSSLNFISIIFNAADIEGSAPPEPPPLPELGALAADPSCNPKKILSFILPSLLPPITLG